MTLTTTDLTDNARTVERGTIEKEMGAHALTCLLWLALDCAQRTGWPQAVDRLSELWDAAVKRERERTA